MPPPEPTGRVPGSSHEECDRVILGIAGRDGRSLRGPGSRTAPAVVRVDRRGDERVCNGGRPAVAPARPRSSTTGRRRSASSARASSSEATRTTAGRTGRSLKRSACRGRTSMPPSSPYPAWYPHRVRRARGHRRVARPSPLRLRRGGAVRKRALAGADRFLRNYTPRLINGSKKG